jgi:putative transcriptional regulator
MQPAAGSLLIASATLMDPNFIRTVLLVLDSEPGGTLGVVLNRPTDTAVDEVLEPWRHLTSDPGVFFRGGPVELNAALAVGAMREGARPPAGWRSLSDATNASIGIVDLDSSPDEFLGQLTALRVYAGYTGWGAEQLENEIAEGSWHIVPSTHADLFTSDPAGLWRQVLARQPTPLSFMATLPEDPNLN